MPGTNLTRDEAADPRPSARRRLLRRGPRPHRLRQGVRQHHRRSGSPAASPARPPSPTSSTATSRRISLNGSRPRPARGVRRPPHPRWPGWRRRTSCVVEAELPFSHTGEGLHRFVDPVDGRVYTYTQFEVPDARRVYTTFEQPDLKSVFTFTVTAPDGWTVISNAATPEPETVVRRRRLAGRSAGPSACRRTSPRSSPGSTTRSTTSTRARTATIPLGPLLPPVGGRPPRRRGAARGHQAGLRVLRGRLRLPLPVRQVRPGLRAGVQHGRDGERRVRDASATSTSRAPARPTPSTSSAPTPCCTRWRTCGSATS